MSKLSASVLFVPRLQLCMCMYVCMGACVQVAPGPAAYASEWLVLDGPLTSLAAEVLLPLVIGARAKTAGAQGARRLLLACPGGGRWAGVAVAEWPPRLVHSTSASVHVCTPDESLTRALLAS